MITPIFELYANGTRYTQVTGKASDVQKEFVNPDKEVYGKVTKKQIGVQVMINGTVKNVYFKDLKENTENEVKTLKFPMLRALVNSDFTNDNTTFFMLERGLVNEKRNQPSSKGLELCKLLGQ